MNINLENINFNIKKKELHKNGFVIIRNLIPTDFLKKIELETLKVSWQSHKLAEVNFIHTDKFSTLSSTHNLVLWSETYKSLYQNENLKKIFFLLLDNLPDKQQMINSSYFYKSKFSKDIKPHQDNAYFSLKSGINCLTFYIPIHAQSKRNGTIYYFAGSHELGFLEHEPKGNIGASMCLKKTNKLKKLFNYGIKYISLKPGDVVIHNALVVHGTLPNPLGNSCEAFNFTFFGENNKLNQKEYKIYKDKLKLFLEEKNNF